MRRQVEWAKRALKALSRIDRGTQNRILAAIENLAERNQGDIRRLEGLKEEVFRLRVGGWRVIFSYPSDAAILVLRIRPRGDVYKR
ncbi:MAG: type II toxin-antitoxin system RelE/ParE family toxin [Acidobacteria bacterium]|nr:type II toxin-antitoxin system RelE/ParE family toxin [Acidobacteriota bacterium]